MFKYPQSRSQRDFDFQAFVVGGKNYIFDIYTGELYRPSVPLFIIRLLKLNNENLYEVAKWHDPAFTHKKSQRKHYALNVVNPAAWQVFKRGHKKWQRVLCYLPFIILSYLYWTGVLNERTT